MTRSLRTRIIIMILYLIIFCTHVILGVTRFTGSGRRKYQKYESFTIRDNDTMYFNHLIVSHSTDAIYIGAVNRIYKLSASMKLLDRAETGPQKDNPLCSTLEPTCAHEMYLANNYNKVLLLHPEENSLITCGTVFQGACEVRQLTDLSKNRTYYEGNYEYFVASNSESASTVAFIAPGPPDLRKSVMYVATTYTGTEGNWLYRDRVPALSTRDIGDRMFELSEKQQGLFERSSSMELAADVRSTYKIKYVTGFTSSVFSYFLTIQGDNVENPTKNVTKIIQICQRDQYFTSYVDIPLQCKMRDGMDYNIIQAAAIVRPGKKLAHNIGISVASNQEVLVASFLKEDAAIGRYKSAVCVYSMHEIRDVMDQNIRKCYKGDSSVSGGGYINVGSALKVCIKVPYPLWAADMESAFSQYGISSYLCNKDDVVHSNIVGTMPLIAKPVLEYDDTWITAVAAIPTTDHVMVFLGTSDGTLKKTVVEKRDYARQYSDILIESDSRVNADMKFDSTNEYLYVMTRRKLTKVPVAECHHHNNCATCLAQGDPFCGWCLLESRCTQQSQCRGGRANGQWLYGQYGSCISILDMSPRSVAVNRVEELFLTMNLTQLPDRGEYSCVFRDFNWSSPARRMTYGLQCRTPDVSKLGKSIGTSDHKVVTLALNSSETGVLFLEKKLSFYNCSSYATCTECTSSSWSCDWCIYDNKCTHDSRGCQPGIIIGRHSQPTLDRARKGPSSCPRLSSFKTGQILVPHAIKKEIIVSGHHLPSPFAGQAGYKCIVKVPGIRRVIINATWQNTSLVRCHSHAYQYSSHEKHVAARLNVVWGHRYHIDQSLTMTIYKCNVIGGGECGICMSANYDNPRHGCRWCDGGCQHRSQCLRAPVTQCPVPVITHVEPMTGPLDGGTNITIHGHNLGSRFEDIEQNITVAGYKCSPIRHKYQVSRTIVCTMQASWKPLSGPVAIHHRSGLVLYEKENFQYLDPVVERMAPTEGPVSGGSTITIYGKNLRTGSVIRAFIRDVPCNIDRNEVMDEKLMCRTDRSPKPGALYPLTVMFDNARRVLNQTFQYRPDPIITRIKPLKSILSGGQEVMVKGRNFASIQQPQMFVCFEDVRSEYTKCRKIDDTSIACPTPRAPASIRYEFLSMASGGALQRFRRTSSRRYKRSSQAVHRKSQVGFVMDDVQELLDLPIYYQRVRSELYYYPDPFVYNFTDDGGIKRFKGEALIIEGHYLDLAGNENDYHILIGQELCEIQSLSDDNIVCTPPLDQPKAVTGIGGEVTEHLPLVTVVLGNARFPIGRIEYALEQREYEFPMEAIAGIAAAGGFLLLVIIIILVISHRRGTKADRTFRKLQIQLDNMESNVRNECKQAFAELQTDMTDLTSDLVTGGIPFWDYHTYTFKILFPGFSDHVILHPVMKSTNQSDQGLQMFYRLLNNKFFMISFIKTLEEQKSFGIRDKCNVASLVMIVFQNNLEYATEILKSLLNDLVLKTVCSKHPKLMLRRTESVVEKLLTNWLSLCLYKYLKECAGPSLFILYKAIKLQAEKGPVDFFTGDARYSLSEDRLLREKIEPKSVLLHVEHEGEVFQTRVLDCDTITQVKDKILDTVKRNTPCSQRPSVDDLDLEMRNSLGAILILSDDDHTTEVVDTWKRINSLGHYGIQDGSSMALVEKDHNKSYNGTFDSSTWSNSVSVPLMNSRNNDHDSGTKVWHLVKQDDNAQTKDGTKMISEIFLTRLLSTKGTLQKFIDDLFSTILTVNQSLPPVIKYLFDFLDSAAIKHGIADPEVVHTWKSNSLPLRFWVNKIKNPDFVFDIDKPLIVDSCLSVIAQTFMDSCSTAHHCLGKDSPSNKLLFAKDIPNYKKIVEKYYKDVQERPSISDAEMNTYLADLSRMAPADFNIENALRELYSYVNKYSKELLIYLDEDPTASRTQLSSKLSQVISAVDDDCRPVKQKILSI